jgi:hypothetical protein
MKLSQQLIIVGIAAVVAFGGVAYMDMQARNQKFEQVAGKSPKQITPKYVGLGSGHAFGLHVTYTLARKGTDEKGFIRAVVVSDEPGVEIYTYLPLVATLSVGTKFRFEKETTFLEDSFQLVQSN